MLVIRRLSPIFIFTRLLPSYIQLRIFSLAHTLYLHFINFSDNKNRPPLNQDAQGGNTNE